MLNPTKEYRLFFCCVAHLYCKCLSNRVTVLTLVYNDQTKRCVKEQIAFHTTCFVL